MVEPVDEDEFDKFLKAAFKYDPEQEHQVIVFCEDCDDLTTISTKTGVACGHRPKWLDDMQERFG